MKYADCNGFAECSGSAIHKGDETHPSNHGICHPPAWIFIRNILFILSLGVE